MRVGPVVCAQCACLLLGCDRVGGRACPQPRQTVVDEAALGRVRDETLCVRISLRSRSGVHMQ
eukprot:335941-Pyramimonas_sp.AAC.1